MRLPDYFFFVFAVCVLVSACIVLFYAKRSPNPHFRPKKSDIGLVSFLLLFVSGGVAFVTSGAFDTATVYDPDKMKEKMEQAKRASDAKGTSTEEELGFGTGGGAAEKPDDNSGGPDLPDDAPEELRDLLKGN